MMTQLLLYGQLSKIDLFTDVGCIKAPAGKSDWSTLVPLLYWTVYCVEGSDFSETVATLVDAKFTFHLMFGDVNGLDIAVSYFNYKFCHYFV